MIVCVPTEGAKGLDERIANDVGSAPTFTLFDSSTNKIKVVERGRSDSGNAFEMADHFPNGEIDAVIVSKMEEKSIAKLKKKGIVVYEGARGTLAETIMNWGQGRLARHI